MPLISPILLANNTARQESLRLLLPITLGRIFGYILLSAVAFLGSTMVQALIKDKVLMGYLLGTLTLIIALRLWNTARTTRSCCNPSRTTAKGSIPLFMMGMVLSMSICAPVVMLMTLSAASSSLPWALLYGLFFGLGATLLWLLFFSVVLTAILRESLLHLRQYNRILEQMAPVILAGVGIAIFNGWIHL